MNFKKELFHYFLRLGKKNSKRLAHDFKDLSVEAVAEKRKSLIQMMRQKSRFLSKVFHALTGSYPKGVQTESVRIGGIEGLKFTPATPSKRIVLYLHGGGFVLGLQDTVYHHSYLPNLAQESGATIYEIDYRVAPEFPFPAAVEDVLSAYKGLLELGVEPKNLVVIGDSAGGTLTLSLMLQLRDLGLPLPCGCVTFSPATAPVASVDSYHTREELDLMFTKEVLSQIYSPAYTSSAHAENPYLYPLYGEYKGLPPMMIFVGGREMLYDHSILVADKAKQAGVDVTLDIHEEMIHAYPVLHGLYDEAKSAMSKVVKFMDRVAM